MNIHSRRRAAGIAFVALFALSQALLWFAYYAHGAKALIGDEQSYQDTALSILAGGAWMPSSIWPPLQPLLLAALYGVFGVHVLVAQVAQTLLFIGCAALLRGLWRDLGGSVAAANWAAALFLLAPEIAGYAQWLWPEIPHLFLLLATLRLLARARRACAREDAHAPARAAAPSRAEQQSRDGARGRTLALCAMLAGACVGLALLEKSLLAAFWPLLLLAFVRRTRPWFAWRGIAAFALALGIVTAPALWHGWRNYGTPMIADSSIYNLWVGLTDRWRSDYVADMGGVELPAFLASGATPRERNAVYLDKVREHVANQGVANVLAAQLGRQYFRLFNAKTSLVSQLPGPACAGHLSVYRTSPLVTRLLGFGNDAAHALILVAAAFGLAGWRRRVGMLHAIAALFLAYQLALFALIHVKARFLLPMLPFLCGLAGDVLARAVAPRRVDGTLALAPPRLLFGTALAALLLFLAFAPAALDGLCTR